MSTLYGGANSFPVNITIPSDGDTKDAASVNVSLEGLADRTKYLKGFIDGTSSGGTLDGVTLTGTTTVSGPINIGALLTATAGADITGGLTADTLHVTGVATFDSSGTFTGIVTADSIVVSEASVPDSNSTASSPPKAIYVCLALTGDRTFKLDLGIPGQVVRFITFEAAHTLTIQNISGVTFQDPSGNNIILKAASVGNFNGVEMVYSALAGNKWIWAGGVPN
jgi:hypothetical protein